MDIPQNSVISELLPPELKAEFDACRDRLGQLIRDQTHEHDGEAAKLLLRMNEIIDSQPVLRDRARAQHMLDEFRSAMKRDA
jgi:hypothetical protein